MLHIVKDSNPSLRERSVDVELPLSEETKHILDEMLQYLKDSQDPEFRKIHTKVREGVGLAAPQIGINKRMLVIHYQTSYAPKAEYITYQLVNPKIVSESIKKCYLSGGEGCLSVDNEHKGYVPRNYKIVVEAFSYPDNKQITITARGFDAIVLQHEIDHLSGILFYDHINKTNPFEQIPGAVEI